MLRDGWFWMIPLPEGRTSVGLVTEGTRVKSSWLAPADLLEEALRRCPAARERMRDARRLSGVWSASDYSYECDQVAGDGYLLLGDAAAFIDPIFSTGVWLAMSSAEMAADTLHRALGPPSGSAALAPEAFAAYARKVRRHVHSYTRIVSRFYEPGFMDIFLQPSTRGGITEAVTSLLAGLVEPPASVRLRLWYQVLRLQRHFRIVDSVPLLGLLEESKA